MRWIESLLRIAHAGETRLAADGFAAPASRLRWALVIWVLAVVVTAAAVHIIKFPPIWDPMADPLVLLDTAWRVWHGQVPHRDFYSVIGPFPQAVFGLTFFIENHDATGLPKALLLVGVLLSGWSWWISRDRLSVWWRLLVAVLVLLLPVAPVPLGGGDGPPFGALHHTTYAMAYNRLGWAALFLQMLVMLVPWRGAIAGRDVFWEAVLGGVLLALGVFCKINFLVGALALGGYWALFCPRPNWMRMAGLLAGCAVVAFVLALFPGGVAEYFGDQLRLQSVSRAQSYLARFTGRVQANLPWVLLLPAVHVWILAARSAGAGFRQTWPWTRSFFAAFAVSFLVTTFNVEGGEVPGLVIASLITLEMALRTRSESECGASVRCFLVKVCAGLLALSYLCFDVSSFAYALSWKLRKPNWQGESEALPGRYSIIPIPVYFNEPTERAEVTKAIFRRRSGPWSNPGTGSYMTPLQATRWINDGVELLAPRVTPEDRIFVADWYNPFNLAFGLPPAKGGAMLWDIGVMVDDRVHPDVQRALEEITIFMVPKREHLVGQPEFMLRTYGKGLGTEFVRDGESEIWTCWRRVRR